MGNYGSIEEGSRIGAHGKPDCSYICLWVSQQFIRKMNLHLVRIMEYMPHASIRIRPLVQLACWYALLVMALLVAACGNDKRRSDQHASDVKNADSVREEVLKGLSGDAITKKLSAMGLAFQKDALNDITRLNHYLQLSNRAGAAANLGVYMSDLGYLTDHGVKEDARRYFDGCIMLSDYVGVNKQFSRAVDLKFSEIISGNEDLQKSLDILFRNATDRTDGEGEFKKMHAAALAGYYVEELYHLVVIAKSDQAASDSSLQGQQMAVRTLINQRQALGNLIGYFDNLQLKPEGIVVYQEMLALQAKYLRLDAQTMNAYSDQAAVIADKRVQEIFASIVSIRKSIVDF